MGAQTLLDSNFGSVSQFEAYTVVDANQDYQTWQYDDIFMAASCPRDYDADDWLITPRLQLEAGKTYLLTFDTQLDQEGAERLAVMLGGSATVGAMTTTLMAAADITAVSREAHSHVFTVDVSGDYYLGFHCSTTGDPYSNRLYLKSIKVEETVSQQVPAGVTDFTVVPFADGQLKADVSLRTPDVNIGGTALAELLRVDLYRGNSLIRTFDNPGIGQLVSCTDTPPAAGAYTYRAVPVNSFGEGEAVSLSAYVGADIPGSVENLRFVYDYDQQLASLTWDAPTTGANGGHVPSEGITYSVRRFHDDVPVATGLTSTAFTDEVGIDFLKECEEATRKKYEDIGMPVNVTYVVDGQGLMQYYVKAETAAGQGPDARSNSIVIGEQSQLPYTESFAGGRTAHFWRTDITTSRIRWSAMADQRFTQDNDGGMLGINAAEGGETAMCHTGNISMGQATSPVLTFYYFYPYTMTHPLTVKVAHDGGDFETLTTIPLDSQLDKEHYVRASVPLTGCAGHEYVQAGFEVTTSTTVDILYIDNITIIDQRQNDLSVEIASLPRTLKVGSPAYMTARVSNLGTADVPTGRYTVEAYVGGVKAASSMGMAVKAGTTQNILLALEANIDMQPADGQATGLTFDAPVYAEVVFEADEQSRNDRSGSEMLTVKMPRHPQATALSATLGHDGVRLTWNQPAPPRTADATVTEGFEDYEDFRLSNYGEWTLYDQDRLLTWGISGWQFTDNSKLHSFIIWNPSQVVNRETGSKGLPYANWAPYSGQKCAASFGVSIDNCDDWLVSPELSGNQQMLSFYARQAASDTGPELFQLYISTSGVEPQNFMAFDPAPRQAAPSWTQYEYMLPQGTRHFALRKVTPADNSFALLVDEVCFAPDTLAAQTGLMLYGYNVYKNGARVNTALVAQPTFVDPDGQPGDVYRVTVIYNQGESVYSNEAVVAEPDGIAPVAADASASPQPRYDLGGRVSSPAAKGLVVQPGKKVIVK